MKRYLFSMAVIVFLWLWASGAPAQEGGKGKGSDDAAELAKKLQNPIADLISVPIQNNWDFGIGPGDAMRYTAHVQPGIPFSLSRDWNLITRTIMPVSYAESPVVSFGDKYGLGDIMQSFFFSPKEPVGGWPVWRLEALAGGRYYYPRTRVEADLTGPRGRTVSLELDGSRDWADPIVGGRFSWRQAERWLVGLRSDFGGFTKISGRPFTLKAVLGGSGGPNIEIPGRDLACRQQAP